MKSGLFFFFFFLSIYSITLGTVFCALFLFNFSTTCQGNYYQPHFTDEENCSSETLSNCLKVTDLNLGGVAWKPMHFLVRLWGPTDLSPKCHLTLGLARSAHLLGLNYSIWKMGMIQSFLDKWQPNIVRNACNPIRPVILNPLEDMWLSWNKYCVTQERMYQSAKIYHLYKE